jgi:hypothetical protein
VLHKAIRTLEILAAIAGIVAFYDTYFRKSALARELHLPATLPTGAFFAIVLPLFAVMLILALQFGKQSSEKSSVTLEKDRVLKKLNDLRVEHGKLEKMLIESKREGAQIQSRLQEATKETANADLVLRIIASLESQSRDERGLQLALDIALTDVDGKKVLQKTIGDLIGKQIVRRQTYGFAFELQPGWQDRLMKKQTN